MNLCMRMPTAPGLVELPADATLAWDALIVGLTPALAGSLPNPGSAVQTVLRRFTQESAALGTPFPLDPGGPVPIDPIRPTVSNTFELGYKGLLGGRILLAADAYLTRMKDFVGPLRIATPAVFLDPVTTAGYVSTQLAPEGQLPAQSVCKIRAATVSLL